MSLNTRCYAHATDDVHVISGGFSWNGNDFNCAVILRLVGTEKHVDIEGAPCHRPGMLFCPDGHALRQWAEEINSTFLAFISPSQSPVSIDYQSMVSGASSTSTPTRLVMRGNPAIEISRQHEPERDGTPPCARLMQVENMQNFSIFHVEDFWEDKIRLTLSDVRRRLPRAERASQRRHKAWLRRDLKVLLLV